MIGMIIIFRLKSRTIPNKDLCRGCFERSGELEEDYFLIENIFEEMAFHEYIACTCLCYLIRVSLP